ncbi:MAG: hypothetical protein Q4A55_06545 [Aerococcus sp.]|nr:hypothetical protein [Aerococcus sp.]
MNDTLVAIGTLLAGIGALIGGIGTLIKALRKEKSDSKDSGKEK